MSDRLYFVPILAHALQQEHVLGALHEAFRQIETLGRQPDYQEGYRQFLVFMNLVHAEREGSLDDIEQALAETLSTFEGEGREAEKVSGPGTPVSPTQEALDVIRQSMKAATNSSSYTTFLIEKDGDKFAAAQLPLTGGTTLFPDITPGPYCLKLASGRVLWEGELLAGQLLMAEARPGKPLKLAADTGDERRTIPTHTIRLLDGEVVVKVFAGLESGRIELFAQPKGEDSCDR